MAYISSAGYRPMNAMSNTMNTYSSPKPSSSTFGTMSNIDVTSGYSSYRPSQAFLTSLKFDTHQYTPKYYHPDTSSLKFDTTKPYTPTYYHPVSSLKFDTQYTPKYYQPGNMLNFNYSSVKAASSTSIVPRHYSVYGMMNKEKEEEKNEEKEKEKNKKKKRKQKNNACRESKSEQMEGEDPDLNNNFLIQRRGRYGRNPPRWSDECVYDRICELAQPKRLPCEYQDCRRSVYWITPRPPPKVCCNHTHFETTPRLDELAIPKFCGADFPCERHCDWDDCHAPPPSCKDPRTVDWYRLATPKFRYPPNASEIQHVKKTALKASPTKRLCKLSVPKPVIDSDKFYLWLWHKKLDKDVLLKKVQRLHIKKCYIPEMRVMIRCDLEPSTNGDINTKLDAVIPTLKYALEKEAKSVVIISKVGNTGGRRIAEHSLKYLVKQIEEQLERPIVFLDDCIGYQAQALCEDPEPGSVFFLENLNFHAEEVGKGINDKGEEYECKPEDVEKFRRILFDMCDTYVVESFPELVHMTTTTVGDPRQEKAYGFKVKKELEYYNRFVVKPELPMVAIVGGTYKDKMKIVRNLMGKATEIVLGGEIAMIFLKVLKRIDIGNTPCTPKMEKKALKLHSRAKDTGTALRLPSDVVVRNTCNDQYFTVLTREDIDDWFEVVDIGPFTRKCYVNAIENARTVIWCGPLGVLCDGTNVIGEAFTQATIRGASTYVVDCETTAFFNMGPHDPRVTHVTGDGECTTMLLKGILPKGLAVLHPYRRKIRKREPPQQPVSTKPTVYEIPGMQIASGEKIMCINDISVEDKRVLIRVDFNVPMKGNQVLNNYCMRMTIPTIKYALKWRARAVIILSHFRNPAGKKDPSLTMKPICDELASLLGHTVIFVPECVGQQVEAAIKQAHPGSILMLENVRFHPEETGAKTTKRGLFRAAFSASEDLSPEKIAVFCEQFSRLGDVYVNDAFASMYHDHSTLMSYFGSPRVCGFLVKNELKYMARLMNYPHRRVLIIIGGNDFAQKIPLLKSLLKEADDIILAGAFGTAFLKVDQGLEVGASHYDPVYEKDIKAIVELSKYYSCRLHYPVDLWIANASDYSNPTRVNITEAIPAGYAAVDVGDLTKSMFRRIIKRSKMIVWLGVVGVAEKEEFAGGTTVIMNAIIEAGKDPENPVVSIVAGESNCAFLQKAGPDLTGFTHLTTGGLVTLKILAERHLIGVESLTPKPNKRPPNFSTIEQESVADKKILVRADLNVPYVDGRVEDTFPLKHLVASIKYLRKKGAKMVMIAGHQGEPEGKPDEDLTLLPIKTALESMLEEPVRFIEEGVSEAAEAASKGESIVLLENLLFHPEEEGFKEGPNGERIMVSYEQQDEFRSKLSGLCDIYMNEAFSQLYQKHSSIVGIKNVPKVTGPTLAKEVKHFFHMRNNMERPLLAIMASIDVVTAMTRLYKLLDIVNEVIICGSLAFSFLKPTDNIKMGTCKAEPVASRLVPRILKKAKLNNINIHLPVDFFTVVNLEPPRTSAAPPPKPPSETASQAEDRSEMEPDPEPSEEPVLYPTGPGIPNHLHLVDIGTNTLADFVETISRARTIVFDGLITSHYERPRFQNGTRAIFDAISTAKENGAMTVALGMRAGVCLSKMDAADVFNIYSTGVQTCWDILSRRNIPGLQVLTPATPKPLKKLSIDKMELKDKRVLMRLDLAVPTVEGVVLDTDKLEEAAPTIRYALDHGAKCVILIGHRGNPKGYKNHYVRMEPLVVEFKQILDRDVSFIDRPCSQKARTILADPKPGSVFLMENLKFYPAEYGQDAEPREVRRHRRTQDASVSDPDASVTETTAPKTDRSDIRSILEEVGAETASEMPAIDEMEESATESTISVSDEEGGKSIDSLMYQLMTPKTVAQFKEELAACADVFVNDDVTDVEETLTSLEGFGLAQRGCGLLLKSYIQDADDPEIYNLPAIAALSPA